MDTTIKVLFVLAFILGVVALIPGILVITLADIFAHAVGSERVQEDLETFWANLKDIFS